jgi:DNA-binding XRE family transcriptional regulator
MVNLMLVRRKAGMTQEQLADKLHVSRMSVIRWEKGNAYPSIATLLKLSEMFEVSVDYLLGKEK